ncbi:hypothetical protein PQ610_00220 [Tardisphaera miroshnichenkoae]
MRKKVVIAGAIALVIGVVLFLTSPYMFNATLSLDSLLPFKQEQSLNPGENFTITEVPPGKLTTALYNDSAGLPLLINSTGGEISSEDLNGTFAAECYNTGSSSVALYLVNNMTTATDIHYSTLTTSLTGMIAAVAAMLAGIFLAIGGSIVALVGLVLKPRSRPQFEEQNAPQQRSPRSPQAFWNL